MPGEPRRFVDRALCDICEARLEVLADHNDQPIATRCVCCGRIDDYDDRSAASRPRRRDIPGVMNTATRLGVVLGSLAVFLLWGELELVRVPLAFAGSLALVRWAFQPVLDGALDPTLRRAALALEFEAAHSTGHAKLLTGRLRGVDA